jgi:SAM-dependent methyltransferase
VEATVIDTRAASAKTAIARKRVSAPLQWLLDQDLIKGRACNWGEGKAKVDTLAMDERTGYAIGYDPNTDAWYLPQGSKFDTIYVGYVLNTLDTDESGKCVAHVKDHLAPGGTAYFSVRFDDVNGVPYQDGVITRRGTFQTNVYREFRKTAAFLHKTSNWGIFTEVNNDLPMS